MSKRETYLLLIIAALLGLLIGLLLRDLLRPQPSPGGDDRPPKARYRKPPMATRCEPENISHLDDLREGTG